MLNEIKNILKKNRIVYDVNARIKARRLSNCARKLEESYAAAAEARGLSYTEEAALDQFMAGLARRGIDVNPQAVGGLRIFWVGANWDQDNSGFLNALGKFGEVIYFRNDLGGYGLRFHGADGAVRKNDPWVIAQNDKCLIEQVTEAIQHGALNLLMGQMWANYISAEALRKVQEMGVITVNISMDDRLPENWDCSGYYRLGSIGLCSGVDLVLTTCAETCLWYYVEGYPALFWPLASDPKLFMPCDEDSKEYDVSFIGNKYGLRGKIVDGLVKAGIMVAPFGGGWPNGPVGAERAAEIFAKSRIILGVGTVGHNDDVFTLKLRDFDATMSGALYITHRNPDLLKLFEEGKEIECYLSLNECVSKIKHYLASKEERQSVATAGAIRARQFHSWDTRIGSTLRSIGLL